MAVETRKNLKLSDVADLESVKTTRSACAHLITFCSYQEKIRATCSHQRRNHSCANKPPCQKFFLIFATLRRRGIFQVWFFHNFSKFEKQYHLCTAKTPLLWRVEFSERKRRAGLGTLQLQMQTQQTQTKHIFSSINIKLYQYSKKDCRFAAIKM